MCSASCWVPGLKQLCLAHSKNSLCVGEGRRTGGDIRCPASERAPEADAVTGKDVKEGKCVPYQNPTGRGFTAEAAQTVKFCPMILWCRNSNGQVFWLHLFSSDRTAIIHLIPGTIRLVCKAANCVYTDQESGVQSGSDLPKDRL